MWEQSVPPLVGLENFPPLPRGAILLETRAESVLVCVCDQRRWEFRRVEKNLINARLQFGGGRISPRCDAKPE
jgi:hypothetical protein